MEPRMGCLSVLLAILALAAGYLLASPVSQAPVVQVEPAIPAATAAP
jgi:hypothetical protein